MAEDLELKRLQEEVSALEELDAINSRLQEMEGTKPSIPKVKAIEEFEPEDTGFFSNFMKGIKKGAGEDISRQATILSRLASGTAAQEAPIPVSESPEFKLMHPSTWSRKSTGQFLGRGLGSSLPTTGGTIGGGTVGAILGSAVAPGPGTVIGGLLGSAIGGGSTGGAQTLADFYNEARLQGASHEDALEAAKTAGYTSGAINAIAAPLGGVGLKQTALEPGIKSLAGYTAKQGLLQGMASGADIASQNAIANESGLFPKRDITEGLPEAMFAGAAFQGLPLAAAAPGMARSKFKEAFGESHPVGNKSLPTEAGHEMKPFESELNKKIPVNNLYEDIKMLESSKNQLFSEYQKAEAEVEALNAMPEHERSYERYHGTSHDLDVNALETAMEGPSFTVNNLFGPGFYTTDNLSIAKGYSKKGKGKENNIYGIREKREAKLIDLEKPIVEYPELEKVLKEHYANEASYLDSATRDPETGEFDSKLTGEEYFDRIQEIADNEMMPSDEYQEYLTWNLIEPLIEAGYDGLTHTGGRRTKNEPHKVNIYWNPKDLLDVEKYSDPKGEATARLQMIREKLNYIAKMLKEKQQEINSPKEPSMPPTGAPVDIKMIGKKIYGDKASSETDSIMQKVKTKLDNWLERPKLKLESSIFNFQAPIRELGKSAYGYLTDRENLPYRAARFAKHMTGIVDNALTKAVPFWNKEEGRADFMPDSKGLMGILEPTMENKDAFQTYMYARRVKTQELATKGKERNISQEEANATVDFLEQQHPEFKEAFEELQQYKTSLLDMAESTGILNAEGRATWEDMDHVPFYRSEQLEKRNGKLLGTKNKLSGQVSPIKTLTGGSEHYAVFDNGEYKGRYDTREEAERVAGNSGQIHEVGPETADMYENLALNAADLIERSVRNGSILPSIEAGKKVGILESVPEGEKSKNVLQVMEDGEKAYYKVNDPLLYDALTNTLNPKQQGFPFLNGFEWFRDAVSRSIMMMPNTLFKVAMKDQIQSHIMGKDPGMTFQEGVKHFVNPSNWYTTRAFKHEFGKTSDSAIQKMMSMGADVRFFKNKPKDFTKNLLKKANEQVKPINASYLSYAMDAPKNIFNFVDRIGRALELSTRIREYERAKRAGANDAEAGFSSMDYMDYAMRGDNPIVQLLGQTTPFLNAHLAGLHKVSREIMDNNFKNRTVKIGTAVAGLSMMNMINNLKPDDNEEDEANNYMSLPNYIKNDNICIDLYKIPGMDKEAVKKSDLPRWILIPKPWEIGALFSTIPENFVLAASKKKNWKESLDTLKDVVGGNLSFNPAGNPVAKTAIEQYSNKRMFSDIPIVPRSREELEPELQYGPKTSETAKLAGQATGLSPDRIEHAATGLLGPAYLWPIALTDFIIDKAKGKASKKLSEYPIAATFMKASPQQSSYQEEFYQMYRDAEKAYKTLQQYHELEDEDKAEHYEQKHENILDFRKELKSIRKELKDIDDERVEVQEDNSLSPKEKRAKIDALQKDKNSLLLKFKKDKE